MRIQGLDFAAVERKFPGCERIWERDGETAALVHSIKEGELEEALQALNAAPYIRVFDC